MFYKGNPTRATAKLTAEIMLKKGCILFQQWGWKTGNPNIEIFFIPRINIVNGITNQHIQKWRWQVNEKNWINFPDVQGRLYQNKQSIFWSGKVHEALQGFESYSIFPQEEVYCIKHIKEIERQERQNALYETI